MEYRVTLEVGFISAGSFLSRLAALKHRNNLLFLILASLIALVLMSGILSSITLRASECGSYCPNIFSPAKSVRAMVELENEKLTLPSFSLRVEAAKNKAALPLLCSKPRSIFLTSQDMTARSKPFP